MSGKHTPGPWALSKNDDGYFQIRMGTAIEDPGHYDPQHCVDWDGVENIHEDELEFQEGLANITLMSAAPDLLEACEELACYIRNFERNAGIPAHVGDAPQTTKALTAIAKAKGEPAPTTKEE